MAKLETITSALHAVHGGEFVLPDQAMRRAIQAKLPWRHDALGHRYKETLDACGMSRSRFTAGQLAWLDDKFCP
jgi:hypothetical protein